MGMFIYPIPNQLDRPTTFLYAWSHLLAAGLDLRKRPGQKSHQASEIFLPVSSQCCCTFPRDAFFAIPASGTIFPTFRKGRCSSNTRAKTELTATTSGMLY